MKKLKHRLRRSARNLCQQSVLLPILDLDLLQAGTEYHSSCELMLQSTTKAKAGLLHCRLEDEVMKHPDEQLFGLAKSRRR